jgi:hypothetical protein
LLAQGLELLTLRSVQPAWQHRPQGHACCRVFAAKGQDLFKGVTQPTQWWGLPQVVGVPLHRAALGLGRGAGLLAGQAAVLLRVAAARQQLAWKKCCSTSPVVHTW